MHLEIQSHERIFWIPVLQSKTGWRTLEVLCGAFLWCGLSIASSQSLEFRVDLLGCVCLKHLSKPNSILFVLWPCLCVVVCWRWCWSRLCPIWGILRACLCHMCLLCSASSDCSRISYSQRALPIKPCGVKRWKFVFQSIHCIQFNNIVCET